MAAHDKNDDSIPVQIDLIPNLESSQDEKLTDGRDEMNLAEFPICSLSGRQVNPDLTLQFTDQTYDKSRGELVSRTLTVAGTQKHGLPTAIDDEVLLALIQISSARGFPQRVKFSRYEVLNILNWDHSGKSYKRLEEAIDRWTSISLDYENAWREKGLDGKDNSWVDAKFHIIESAKFHRRQDKNSPDHCMIKWGDYIQQSFSAGNVKKLNFAFMRDLKSPIAKRIYRFLDKRFWHKRRWQFDLKEFAFEKIGLSRKLNVGQIKQKLEKPIKELVDQAFIRPAQRHERYEKARVGEWFIIFEAALSKKKQKELKLEVPDLDPLEKILVKRGVTAVQAKKLVKIYPPEFIQEKAELLDFLLGKGGGLAPKNPPGWLVNAIKEDYEAPDEFKSSQQKVQEAAARKEKEKAKHEAASTKKAEIDRLQVEKEAQDLRVKAYLENLSKTKRTQIDNEAMKEARENGFGLGLEDDGTMMKIYVSETVTDIVLGHLGEERVEVPV